MRTFKVSAYGFDGQPDVYTYGLPPLGGTVASNGRYAFRTVDSIKHVKPVSALVRAVEATALVSYRGLTYQLPMWPTDGKPDGVGPQDFSGQSGKGIVRNFVLRTSGLKPGMGRYARDVVDPAGVAAGAFYGGNLTLDMSFGAVPLSLRVVLRPTGPLVDGCPSHTVVHTVKLTGYEANGTLDIHDIPLAPYVLSVTMTGALNRPARLQLYGSTKIATAIALPFRPSGEFADASGSSLVSLS